MKLVVDIGNSRLKWAFSAPEGLFAPGEAALGSPTDPLPQRLLDTGEQPDEIRIANVAGAAIGPAIAAQLAQRFGVRPVVAASAGFGAGVSNGYHQPRQLGVDRWLAMCAAYSRHQSAVWVVDAGTATTLDHVTADGRHLGGLILPGIELMESALFTRTGDLARLAGNGQPAPVAPPGLEEAPGAPAMALGRDTASAIRMGALQATASVIVRYQSGTDRARLVVTGGLAPRLQAILAWSAGHDRAGRDPLREIDFQPALVLEGLALDPPCFAVSDQESP